VLFATIVMGRVGSGNPDNFDARLVNTYGSFYGIGPGPACPGNRGFVVGQQHFAAHRHRGCGLVRRVLYARLFRSALALRSANATGRCQGMHLPSIAPSPRFLSASGPSSVGRWQSGEGSIPEALWLDAFYLAPGQQERLPSNCAYWIRHVGVAAGGRIGNPQP
jgi:hypothetical protein